MKSAVVAIVAVLTGTRMQLTVTYSIPVKRAGIGSKLEAMPDRAMVTGATARAGGTTQTLARADADDVGSAFDAATYGPVSPKATRWLVSLDQSDPDALEIDYAAASGGKLAVTATMEAPTCFFEHARYVIVPGAWGAKLPAKLRVPRSVSRPALAAACGDPGTDFTWARLATRELADATAPRVQVRAARFAVPPSAPGPGGDRSGELWTQWAEVEVATGGPLTDVPADLATVLVVDASRSLSIKQRTAQRALVASYLAHAPAGRVQVVTFARTATALLPAWQPANTAAPAIARALGKVVRGNGSALDAGLREAATWIAPQTGERRIVMLTDARASKDLVARARSLPGLVPSGVRVHVVIVDPDRPTLVRPDAEPVHPALRASIPAVRTALASLAAATHGILVEGSGDATALVRPTTLDAIAIAGPGWRTVQQLGTTCNPLVLAEGGACTYLLAGDPTAGPLAVTASIWGDAITPPVTFRDGGDAGVARDLVAAEVRSSHDDAIEAASLAPTGDHRLFAAWGAPSTYGPPAATTEDVVPCRDCGATITERSWSVATLAPDPTIEPLLVGATAACRGDHPVRVDVEITGPEIVDVRLRSSAVPIPAATQTCIETALWALALPATASVDQTVVFDVPSRD